MVSGAAAAGARSGAAVILVKVAYYKPGRPSGQSPWRNHLQYIAEKPEADRGDADSLRVGDPDWRPEPGGAAGHVEYAAERPGSSGLFGPDPKHPPDWREVARELERHPLPAWRIIVSMREEDAAKWGVIGREKWEPAVRRAVAEVAKGMGLSLDYLRWVAAYHNKPGQPHAHLVIWEQPHVHARRRGLLQAGERRAVWRAFARELFRDERVRLGAERSALRDEVRGLAARAVEESLRWLDSLARQPGVPPIPRERQMEELGRRLQELAGIMPGKGRIALAFMPEEVKAKAREMAEWLLSQPGFRQQAERYQEIARDFAQHFSGRAEAAEEADRNAHADLRDRVAQVVLRGAAALSRNRGSAGPEARAASGVAREAEEAPRSMQEGPSREAVTVARGVWKAAWRAIERERALAEARTIRASEREAALRRMRALEAEEERTRGR